MKFIKILLILILIVLVIFGIAMLLMPDKYTVSRSIQIKAPASIPFNYVNKLCNWNDWTPLPYFDPDIKIEYKSDCTGEKAGFSWQSNEKKLGSGDFIWISSEPYHQIKFLMKTNSGNNAESNFFLEENDGITTITWTIQGKFDFIHKWMSLFKEEYFGPILEKGLKNLKKIAEKRADININITITTVPDQTYISIRDTVYAGDKHAAMGALAMAYNEIYEFISKNNIQLAGPPVSFTVSNDINNIFDAAMPVIINKPVKPTGRIHVLKTIASNVVKAEYTGSYDNFDTAYEFIHAFIKNRKLTTRGYSWTEFISDPGQTKTDKLVTFFYFPIE